MEFLISEEEYTNDSYKYGTVESDQVAERTIIDLDKNWVVIEQVTGEIIYSKNEDGGADRDFEKTGSNHLNEIHINNIDMTELLKFVGELIAQRNNPEDLKLLQELINEQVAA